MSAAADAGAAPLAALPMYDWPETAPALDRLWVEVRERLRARGIAAPDALERGIGLWQGWLHPGLVLGQSCALPYREVLHGRVTLVGTADWGLEGAPPGFYYSRIVVRAADRRARLAEFAGARLAINGPDSQSGWGAAFASAAEAGIDFGRILVTGAHRASAAAVAAGEADIAFIDAVTWRLVLRFMPEVAARLRVIGASRPTPGLPFIARAGADAAAIRAALAEGLAALDSADRELLGMRAILPADPEAYLAVPRPPEALTAAPRRSAGAAS
ncbi:MAG: hypothetical protein D6832_01645 [Alphaproteobacteria bacterium]|nr:MAG: hypothetical protein D6832_01645 [Alphaproteobacteria bacterium]